MADPALFGTLLVPQILSGVIEYVQDSPAWTPIRY